MLGFWPKRKLAPMSYLRSNTVTNTGSYLMLGRTLSTKAKHFLWDPPGSLPLCYFIILFVSNGDWAGARGLPHPSSWALTGPLPSLPFPLALAACSPCDSGINNHRSLKCVFPAPGRQCHHDTALNIFKVIWRVGTEQFTTQFWIQRTQQALFLGDG